MKPTIYNGQPKNCLMIPEAKETVHHLLKCFFMKKDFWGDKNRIPSLLSEQKILQVGRQNYGNDTPLGKNSSNDLKIGENEAVLLIAACHLVRGWVYSQASFLG